MTYPMLIEPMRHPKDPDPVRSSKAVAVLVLGIVATLTGPMIGGVVPAVVAFILARQTRADLAAAGGFLTGRRYTDVGVAFAWIGIALAATALVIATVVGLLHLVPTGSAPDFDPQTS